MKKLLVIPIMLAYYLLMAVPFLIQLLLIFLGRTAEWLQSLADQLGMYLEEYIMNPAARIHAYALRIMRSDKILQQINEASNKLKRGIPINEEGGEQ